MTREIFQNQNISVDIHRQQVEDAAKELLLKNNLKAILAISGGSESEKEKILQILAELIANVKDFPIAILTGGTEGGVPELGIRLARESSLPTIGVFPPGARKYVLLDSLDLAIEALPPSFGRPTFGTETSSFVNMANGIAVVGGGFGTLTEVSTALKVNVSRIKKGERPIFICPISGTGGTADIITQLPDIYKVKECLPESLITTGIEAALFFREKML